MPATSDFGGSLAPPCPRPVYAAAAVLLGSFLVGFDTRLFSVGLPDLRGAFGLSYDQGAWLNTYATAPQIFIAPAVAWLAATFGVRRVLFWPSLVYAIVSLVIPMVRGWETLICLHLLRGLLLGVFIPATIMIVFRNLPPRWWVPALGIYAFRVAFSQTAGPLLIGFYDQSVSWQWIYWQDVLIAPVIGILITLGTPRERVDLRLLSRADWGGMALLGSGTALIYAAMDQGNRLDWMESGIVATMMLTGGTLVIAFLINESVVRFPWASHKVIMSRNIGGSFFVILCFSTSSLSNSMLPSSFLGLVMGFRPEQIGLALFIGTALPLMITLPLAVILIRHFDARITMILGFIAFAIAARMGTHLTHLWSPWTFLPMGLLQSVGQGFIFLAAVVYILANSDPKHATAMAAYIQVLRLGGAEIATTLMATFLTHREQLHSYLLGLHLPVGQGDVTEALKGFTAPFVSAGSSGTASAARGALSLSAVVAREANTLAYIDGFQLTFWAAVAGLVVIALLGPAPMGPLSPKH